jgi:hypothetical protein
LAKLTAEIAELAERKSLRLCGWTFWISAV